jgi:hypothetical protein
VFLLLDHHSGLFQTVKDISVGELRSNTVTLAKLAKLMKIPVITTASEPKGTNGPLEENYAADHLDLVLVRGYLARMVSNPRISEYLQRHHPEIAAEFIQLAQRQATAA